LSAFVSLVCSIYAVGYFRHEEGSGILQEAEKLGGRSAVGKLREYYALMPFLVFAMTLVALAKPSISRFDAAFVSRQSDVPVLPFST